MNAAEPFRARLTLLDSVASMYERDRLANLALLAAAAVGWLIVAFILLNYDPAGRPAVLLAGALAMGGALALTATPLLWLLGFVSARCIAYRGDWARAARRGVLVGLVVSIFVVLLGQGLFSPPLALFVLAMAVLIEVTLSLRR